jgi:HEAT repeat protein
MGDPSVLIPIRKLRNHEHLRVREEVLKTLLFFHDPEADRLLLADLRSLDPEIRRSAIQLAEMSKDPHVFRELLELLHRSPANGPGIDLKHAIVRSLSKIGDPAAFTHLEKAFRSKSYFHGQALNRLKEEIIKSLEFYPPRQSMSFLNDLSKRKEKQFVPLVSQTLERVKQRSPA